MMSARRERIYGDEEITELLEKAAAMGIPLDRHSDVAEYSIDELERMVTVKQ